MSDIGRRLVKVGGGRVEVETFDVPEPGTASGPFLHMPAAPAFHGSKIWPRMLTPTSSLQA